MATSTKTCLSLEAVERLSSTSILGLALEAVQEHRMVLLKHGSACGRKIDLDPFEYVLKMLPKLGLPLQSPDIDAGANVVRRLTIGPAGQ